MVNVHGMARLGVLAVGFVIGAAWAHTPIALADSSSDWSSTIDSVVSGAAPAPATPIDLDISFDGYTIYDGNGSAYADTTTGDYSLAIAYGDGAYAYALGTGGSAYADGSGADAYSGGGTGDVAEAVGTNASANAGGNSVDTGANYDTAIDIGNNVDPSTYPGTNDGAYAGNADLVGSGSGTGAYDTAIDIGNNTNDGLAGGSDGSFAGAGGLDGGSGDGNNDTAIDVGNNSGEGDGSDAGDGNGNYASESGGATGVDKYAYAGQGNDNTAVGTTDNANVDAVLGNDNYAYVDGPANSTAYADNGDSNVAYVSDPFGAAGSPDSAFAGDGFSNDLAEVLFAHGNASAETANLLYDIVSLFGNTAGSF
jgi:hypothetical protein